MVGVAALLRTVLESARVYGEERAKKPLSPVMRQYHAAKAAYPDAILFFRLGDFYEMFHDDAVVASRALDLTLTSRNKGAADEVPMAGVPHHAAARLHRPALARRATRWRSASRWPTPPRPRGSCRARSCGSSPPGS